MVMRVAGFLLMVPGVLMLALTVVRARLPYNEQGRYLNVDDVGGVSVVYESEIVPVYGMIAGLLLVVAVGLIVVGWKRAGSG